MAGWYQIQEKRPRSALKLLGARRRVESPPADSSGPLQKLREEHMTLVSEYCGTYPDDAEERIRCNRSLHEQPQRPAA
jgi:hypothetical protein